LHRKKIGCKRELIMESRTQPDDKLQDLQKGLETQRRQILAAILELQDAGASPEETEGVRLKLLVINNDLARCTAKLKERGKRTMGVENQDKREIIIKAMQKAVVPALKEVVRLRAEAEAKVQVLEARAENFQAQKLGLEAEIITLKQQIDRVLGEGGDPSVLGRQVREKTGEVEDLRVWLEAVLKNGIPAAKKNLTEARRDIWIVLEGAIGEVKPEFERELNDYLASASELLDSWQAAVRQLFTEYQPHQGPSRVILDIPSDKERTAFCVGGVTIR
jgi:hypothetical protein